MKTEESANCEPLTLRAADGYPISATRFYPRERQRANLIVAGATGVPQSFYGRFAQFACDRGFGALTLDYRGIGRSRPASLKGFEMGFLDWARLDLAAAVDEMSREDVPLFMVGHSFGGHAFGLLPNYDSVSRFYTFATGAGWHGWMPFMESIRVRMMWNALFPVLTWWKGYLPSSMLRLGEDLPMGVYREWRHWCRFPRYFFDDPEMVDITKQYARVRTPIVAANALDDLWALPRSRDAFMRAYANAPLEMVDLDPKSGLGPIGHMGYFRPSARPLWENVLDWFEKHGGEAASRENSRAS